MVAAYRGKRYRDEKSLLRKALVVFGTRNVGATPSTAYNVLSRVLAAGTLDLGAIQILVNPSLHNIMLLDQTGDHTFHLRCLHALPPSIFGVERGAEALDSAWRRADLRQSNVQLQR